MYDYFNVLTSLGLVNIGNLLLISRIINHLDIRSLNYFPTFAYLLLFTRAFEHLPQQLFKKYREIPLIYLRLHTKRICFNNKMNVVEGSKDVFYLHGWSMRYSLNYAGKYKLAYAF